MEKITGIIGRDQLIELTRGEIKKGKHELLSGPVGIGKSAILNATVTQYAGSVQRPVIRLQDHQAKGQGT